MHDLPAYQTNPAESPFPPITIVADGIGQKYHARIYQAFQLLPAGVGDQAERNRRLVILDALMGLVLKAYADGMVMRAQKIDQNGDQFVMLQLYAVANA